jgi:hypothetical protein
LLKINRLIIEPGIDLGIDLGIDTGIELGIEPKIDTGIKLFFSTGFHSALPVNFGLRFSPCRPMRIAIKWLGLTVANLFPLNSVNPALDAGSRFWNVLIIA